MIVCAISKKKREMPRKCEKETGAQERKRNLLVDSERRCIWIQGKISAATATNFETQFHKLINHNDMAVIVFIDSEGGDVNACLKIYQLIAECVKHKRACVYTVGMEKVHSGAFYILQAGMKRYAIPAARFMFHRAARHYVDVTMNTEKLGDEMRRLAVLDAVQLLIFTKRGRPIRTINDLFARDTTIGTKRARELNLIDKVIPYEKYFAMRARVLGISA